MITKNIPIIDLTDKPISSMIEMLPNETDNLFTQAQNRYTIAGLAVGDYIAKKWLDKANNPYKDEINATANALGISGAFLLNISYDWACTTGISNIGSSSRMLRILDWDLPGLGRNLVVAKQAGPAGEYFNITWPGFSGVVTAVAAGRFAIAINQPPLPSPSYRPTGDFGLVRDWIRAKKNVWNSTNLPPVHLLRYVFDNCTNYQDAVKILSTTPVSAPVFFSVCGIGTHIIIERTQTEYKIRPPRDGHSAVANHWLAFDLRGVPRGHDSEKREEMMYNKLHYDYSDMSWLEKPILNSDTRLVMIATPDLKNPKLILQGFENDGAATNILEVPMG